MRRFFALLVTLILLAACEPREEPQLMSYGNTDILTLQAKMAMGELDARTLTSYYLDRIEQLDRQGPALNAVIELNPDALAIADTLDQERRNGSVRGLLHGIPVLLKANIDTADKMATSAGSLALQNHYADRDAFIVTSLRAAGAIILGKTNLSEWANFRSNHSSSGWSSLGGQTRNAYDQTRNPCGSSSGSAVAVAAGLVSVAIGTETDGSIVCPASSNGIVGIKPTLGLVSRQGIIPIAHSQDTAGPMGRTVADAAILYSVLMAEDINDTSAPPFPHEKPDVLAAIENASLKGKRIGVWRNYAGANADARVEQILTNSLATLRRQGAVIVDDIQIETQGLRQAEFEVLLYEFKAGLNAYLAKSDATLPDLQTIITYNQQQAGKVMPFFAQETLELAQTKGPLDEQVYLEALHLSKALAQNGIDGAIKAHELDALIAPTGGPAWLTDHVNGDRSSGISSASLAAVAGYPAVTLPAGFIEGLPVGLTFFGAASSDAQLVALAHAYELVSRVRVAPEF